MNIPVVDLVISIGGLIKTIVRPHDSAVRRPSNRETRLKPV